MDVTARLKDVFPRLRPDQEKALLRLGISSLRDLLYHFPSRYADVSRVKAISELIPGETATIVAKVVRAETKKAWKKKIPMAEAYLEDTSGGIKALWFNQAYIAKMLPVGSTVTLTGRPTIGTQGLYLANAEFDKGTSLPIDSHNSLFNESHEGVPIPIYPESKGVTSRFIYHTILKIIKEKVLDSIVDPLPEDILKRYNLPSLKTALHFIHTPKRENDAIVARKRFAFEEVFYMQLIKANDRALLGSLPSHQIKIDENALSAFLKSFPFSLTEGQQRALTSIVNDFKGPHPMSRLLEGDVGSGKTAVAAAAMYAVVTSTPGEATFGSLQCAYMAPTEILATQHFETFIALYASLLKTTPLRIGLLTGKTARIFPSKTNPHNWTDISRSQLLQWVANGEIAILIGTHTLIQKTVTFKYLAFVVIDEQHRFGVKQRMNLIRRNPLKEKTKKENNYQLKPYSDYKDRCYFLTHLIEDSSKKHTLKELEAFLPGILNNKGIYGSPYPLLVWGKGKNEKKFRAVFSLDHDIVIAITLHPYKGLSEKTSYQKMLTATGYALLLLVAPSPKGIKVIEIQNPKLKKLSLSERVAPEMPVPHLLSMTATPIPRTLALTIYGDLEITVLDQSPKGRLPIITEIVAPTKRNDVYEKIHNELQAGRQVYVICPRIDEPDEEKARSLIAKSVTKEAVRLKKEVFPSYRIGVLHSKMTKEKKEEVMRAFSLHEIDILVATSVVEVGVNVPNATNILIEGAERFGLSQLHQLRGRVMRSTHQPYCYLFTESNSDVARQRLTALKNAKNGFELAELDLKLRGAGELAVGKQWGVSDLAMEAIKNPKMVEAARTEARMIIENKLLSSYPLLEENLEKRSKEIHFE